MEIKQHLKLSQQLVMTPQLRQAIKILQVSRAELEQLVEQELEENPVLEENVDGREEQAPAEEPPRTEERLDNDGGDLGLGALLALVDLLFEHGVLGQFLVDQRLELGARHLQDLDGHPQLRRHHELLGQPLLEDDPCVVCHDRSGSRCYVTVGTLQPELFAQVDGARRPTVRDVRRDTFFEYRALVQNVRSIADPEGFAHVVIRDEDPDAPFF